MKKNENFSISNDIKKIIENGDYVGIYITYASKEKFDRDFMYRIYLRDQHESSVLKSHPEPGIVNIHSEKISFEAGDGYGESKFLKHDDIIKQKDRYCPDGKLHLKIEIYFYDRADDEEKLSANNQGSVKDPAAAVDIDDPLHPFNLMVNHVADVTLKTHDGIELKAHKDILKKKSEVFQKMFSASDSFSGNVEIKEYNGVVMKELLRFIYFNEFRGLTEINIQLHEAACCYEIKELQDLCIQSMRDNLNYENVVEILEFAYVSAKMELLMTCAELVQL